MGGRSSGTVDCRFTRSSSSLSSAISIKRLLRSELVDEDVDPDAVWSEHAAERVVSRRSFGAVIENTVSCGENLSVTALKWTVTRAGKVLADLIYVTRCNFEVERSPYLGLVLSIPLVHIL